MVVIIIIIMSMITVIIVIIMIMIIIPWQPSGQLKLCAHFMVVIVDLIFTYRTIKYDMIIQMSVYQNSSFHHNYDFFVDIKIMPDERHRDSAHNGTVMLKALSCHE